MQITFKYFIVVIVLFFSSCSWQKRLYNKGFYVAKNHVSKKPERKSNSDTLHALLSCIKQIKSKEIPAALLAETSNSVIEIQHPKTKPTLLTDGCDTLFLRNGARVLAKVREVNSGQVNFIYCETTTEIIRTLSKTDIDYIIYSNGYKEVFEKNKNQVVRNQSEETKINGFAIAGFILSMLSVPLSLILAILTLIVVSTGGNAIYFVLFVIPALAIIFCIVALVQIAKNKGTQQGLALAIIGLVIAFILSLILLAIIIATL